MGIFAKCREKCAPIRLLVKFQKSPWYPVLFALLCITSGTHSHTVYVPIMWALVSFVIFSAFFTDDNKVFLVPLTMFMYAIGCDAKPETFLKSNKNLFSLLDSDAVAHIVIQCSIVVISVLLRLIADGTVADALKHRRMFTIGILAMDIAFITNGLFSQVYTATNLFYGTLMVAGFTIAYFLVSGILDRSEDAISYACYSMVATAYVALVQIAQVAYSLHLQDKFFLKYMHPTSGFVMLVNRDKLVLGWGVSTMIAAVFVLGIPAAMYLAKNKNRPLFFIVSSLFFTAGTFMINSRSSMLIGTVALVVCVAACCISGKNRVRIRIYTAAIILLAIVALIVINYTTVSISYLLSRLSKILRISGSNSGRDILWKNGMSDFLSSPVFGVGFNDGGYTGELRNDNVFSNMYHCVFIQIPGAMGVVGCLAFLTHIISLGIACFRRFSTDKLLLLFVPFMILGLSLVDNFFFYPHFQIFYGIFLALAEKQEKLTVAKNITSQPTKM